MVFRTIRTGLGAVAMTMGHGAGRDRGGRRSRSAVLNDQSGVFADNGGGRFRLRPAKLAIEDFGGEIAGRKIAKSSSADHQNKADIRGDHSRAAGSTADVDVIADGAASSAGFAILEVAPPEEQAVLDQRTGVVGLHGQGLLGRELPLQI